MEVSLPNAFWMSFASQSICLYFISFHMARGISSPAFQRPFNTSLCFFKSTPIEAETVFLHDRAKTSGKGKALSCGISFHSHFHQTGLKGVPRVLPRFPSWEPRPLRHSCLKSASITFPRPENGPSGRRSSKLFFPRCTITQGFSVVFHSKSVSPVALWKKSV